MSNDNERKDAPQTGWPFAAFNPFAYAAMFNPAQAADQPKPAADLMAYWQQMYSMNEEQATRYFQQLVSSDMFAAAMNRYVEAITPTQEAIQRNLEKFLQANGLPTRGDITRLAEQIVTLDAKLDMVQDEIEDLIDDNNAGLSATVATLQAALENISTKLDTVAARLDKPETGRTKKSAEPDPKPAD